MEIRTITGYNLLAEQNNNNGNSNDHRRYLNGDDNDGEGDDTGWYNCYDEAGYTNVNKCNKFETQATMEAADVDDLALVLAHGSILLVKVVGKVYDKGGYKSPMDPSQLRTRVLIATLAAIGLAVLIFYVLRLVERRNRRASRRELKEVLTDRMESDDGYEFSTSYERSTKSWRPSLGFSVLPLVLAREDSGAE